MKNLAVLCAVVASSTAQAQFAADLDIVFTPGDAEAPISPTRGVGIPLADEFSAFGVDFTEFHQAIFNDPPLAFGGIGANALVDLIEPVEGRIVQLGTTNQGFTDAIGVEAGSFANGLLEVFDLDGNLLGSSTFGTPNGPSAGRMTATVDLDGDFSIATFRVTGQDSFGVNTIALNRPVPAPASAAMLAGGGLLAARRRR